MDGWFLTYDQGEGRPSVFAFVDDLSQDEIDTLHVLLSEEIVSTGADYETYSCDFLLEDDRAMLIRFRREWAAIKADLENPDRDDDVLTHAPWFAFYYLYLDFREEVIYLRPHLPDVVNEEEEEDEDEITSADAEFDAIVEMIVDANPELLRIKTPEATVPNWDNEAKILYWGVQVARRVGVNAKNVLIVLNAFQEDGWQTRIDSPLPGGRNPERLRDTLKQLNKDLKYLRFSADGSGERIIWTKGEAGEMSPPE